MAEPVKKKKEPQEVKKEAPKASIPKKETPKVVTPKAVAPKIAIPKNVVPKKKDGGSDKPEELEVQQPKEEESLEDLTAKKKKELQAQQLAEQELKVENDEARLAGNDQLRWFSKEVSHLGKGFDELQGDQDAIAAYDSTMRILNLLFSPGKDKDNKGLNGLVKAQTKGLENPTGVTKGTVAPLNGDMKKVATGVSNTIKHGVTPQPSGPKPKGPEIKSPKNEVKSKPAPKASAKPSGPGGGPK